MSSAPALFGPTDPAQSVAEALIDAGLIDQAEARRAAQVAATSGESIVAVIHQLALADDTRVLDVLGTRFDIALAKEEDVPQALVNLAGVSAAFLRSNRVLPLGWSGQHLVAGVIDPTRSEGLAALAFAAGCAAEPRLMSVSAQRQAFDRLYGASEEASDLAEAAPVVSLWADDAQRIRDQSSAGPAVRIVDALLERALEAGASDIHIEPLSDRVRVRLRINGELQTVREEPAHLAAPIAARIKVLADMDIADRRSAQDGRTSLAAKGRPVDVRISAIPSAFGETIALRLLRRDAALLDLTGLGFSSHALSVFERVLAMRRGLFLITGPTGSGKTTTLYAMIERLRGAALKILSIEDPIEYFFPDVTQVQVNEGAGLTFPTALRSFLRQDPDVILIGEIRDAETARIAVQAALTGHLVLATLHTSDAPGAVARLAELGLDRYLIAATLAGAASQRLARKLCQTCAHTREANATERALFSGRPSLSVTPLVSEASGCAACRNTGVAGRLAIAEAFLTDDAVRESIHTISTHQLQHALEAQGFVSIGQEAVDAAMRGLIAPAEVRALALA
jgi:general secretion pathway protein E